MITRLTYFSFLPEKIEELKRLYNEETAPIVRQQKGNLECRLLEPLDKQDDYISMTVWDTQEDANAYHSNGVYKKLVDRIKPYFTKEPVLKVYQTHSIMEHV